MDHNNRGPGSPVLPLPNLLKSWPWPRQMNPAYDAVKSTCATTVEQLVNFSPKQRLVFDRAAVCEYFLFVTTMSLL